MNLIELSSMIEDAIQKIGIDPQNARGDQSGKWGFTHNSASVWIDIFDFPSTNPGMYYLQVLSPLFKVPDTNRMEIAEELLSNTYEMCYARCVKIGDWYYVGEYVPADGLIQFDVEYIIEKVAFYSEDYYGKMTYKYKGSWIASQQMAVNSNGERAKE
jgi:hypothetical protein